jgi:hypothetical protein
MDYENCDKCQTYESELNAANQEIETLENNNRNAMGEINRLRGVAREYERFHAQIKDAYTKQDWAAVDSALKCYE